MFATYCYCMNVKIYLFITVFLGFITSINAQSYELSGVINDEKNEPVAFANILVLNPQDSTVVTGTSSDDKGLFKIDKLKPNKYLLNASFIGYKEVYQNIELTENLDDLQLRITASLENLEEVELFFVKLILKREPDRLVFKVENTALSQGNLVEVLRSTPSVLVLDDTILVQNTPPVVYINDRRVHLSSPELIELLQSTPASNIQSVEVITNPSAKYDADNSVVLNIKMSKNLISGYNGSLFSNYTQGVFPKYNMGISQYLKARKINVFLNYNYTTKKDNRIDKEHIYYPNEEWVTNFNRNTWSETHNASLNIDYDFNKKSSLNLSANTQFLPYFKYLARGYTAIQSADSNINRIDSKSISRDTKFNTGIDLDYVYNANDASRIAANIHYTNYDYQRQQDVSSKYSQSSLIILEQTAFNVLAEQDTEIFTTQLEYAINLSDEILLATGVKWSNVQTSSGILQNDIINNEEILNTNNTNNFNYNEDVYAAFIDYSYNFKTINISAGIRAEQTNIKGLSSNNSNSKQDYLEFFPTINIGYQISDKISTYITYKRSIERPDYRNLNPFVYYLNDNTIVTGNPDLKPVFNDKYVFGTSLGDTFTFEAYYKRYKNNFFELPLQDNLDNVIIYTPINIDSTEEIGFDFEAYLNITSRWFLSLGTSIYKIRDTNSFSGSTIQLSQWSNYTDLTNNVSLLEDKSLTATLSVVYLGENVYGLQTSRERWDTYLTMSKTLLKDNAVISLSVSDLFNKQDYARSLSFLDQRSRIYNDLDTRYVKLGFRYRFGNTALKTNQRTSQKAERDRLKN